VTERTYRDARGLVMPDSDVSDMIVRELFVENVYHVTNARLSGNGVVVDVGANVGAFSFLACQLGARRVIAVEPVAGNRDWLERNTTGRPVEIVPAAVSDHDGSVPMFDLGRDSHMATLARPVLSPDANERPAGDVECITLPSLFDRYHVEECDFLKVDVEGAEFPAFAACPSEVLNRCRFIAIETHALVDADNLALHGALVAKLMCTHKVQTLGSPERGGYLWCERF
jgi:FkbM family methyltransferase